MQLLHSEPEGRHLCILDDAEFEAVARHAHSGDDERLSSAAEVVVWRIDFLRRLQALQLDDNLFNAIARAARHHPERFVNAHGQRMTLEEWAAAVRSSAWSAPWVGPRRTHCILQALDLYLPAPRSAG